MSENNQGKENLINKWWQKPLYSSFDFLFGKIIHRLKEKFESKTNHATAILHKLAHTTRNIIARHSESGIRPSSEDFHKYLDSVTQEVATYFQRWFIKDCRCCIKWYISYETALYLFTPEICQQNKLEPPLRKGLPFQRSYVYTAARDKDSYAERHNVPILYRADCCSPFIDLLCRVSKSVERRLWLSPGNLCDKSHPLPNKKNINDMDEQDWNDFHNKGYFHCERSDFNYKSAVVFPICYFNPNNPEHKLAHINSFLCLDSETPNSFEHYLEKADYSYLFDNLPTIFNILAAISDMLWLPSHLYIPQKPLLKEEDND